jgi:hypothetical protein
MPMKKFINAPEDLTAELLEGFALAFNRKIALEGKTVVRVTPKDPGKVALVTLGGAGHEPALSGFVGEGMLDASVVGDIFAAPGAPAVLAALEAAQSSGGDIRGRQSAAILIVREKPTGRIWKDRVMDLRVEDHPRPVEELRRLVNLHRAYQHENMGDELLAEGDLEGALSEYTAAAVLAPDNLELMFWQAVSLINVGRESEALPLFRKVFKADDNWAVLVERLPDSGLLRVDEDTLERILEQAD